MLLGFFFFFLSSTLGIAQQLAGLQLRLSVVCHSFRLHNPQQHMVWTQVGQLSSAHTFCWWWTVPGTWKAVTSQLRWGHFNAVNTMHHSPSWLTQAAHAYLQCPLAPCCLSRVCLGAMTDIIWLKAETYTCWDRYCCVWGMPKACATL